MSIIPVKAVRQPDGTLQAFHGGEIVDAYQYDHRFFENRAAAARAEEMDKIEKEFDSEVALLIDHASMQCVGAVSIHDIDELAKEITFVIYHEPEKRAQLLELLSRYHTLDQTPT